MNSSERSLHTGKGVVVDIGTGDGRYVYRSAARDPDKFFIGIDANPKPLRKISTKAERKLGKGGGPNVMFVQAAVEDLPGELDGVADEVHIHFPWGSLLRAVIAPEPAALSSIRRICAPSALLEIVAGLDAERDRAELARTGVPAASPEQIIRRLVQEYEIQRFKCLEARTLTPSQCGRIETTWARRLHKSANREFFFILFRAV